MNDQYQIPPCITTLLLQNKEWEIAGIEHSPFGSEGYASPHVREQ